ncbi:DASH family cryptochrome [Pokkaliibacter sp. CJK22405]|uniref:DASH family cryptochrome n=1 Tax=Pokkaliibacter sp. CJK22405 TaxID=3384615 RepID=UPI003984705E
MSLGILWLGDDLRMADQEVLLRAAQQVDSLVIVYAGELSPWPSHNRRAVSPSPFSRHEPSSLRREFLRQGLLALDEKLQALGQRLWITSADSLTAATASLTALIRHTGATQLFRNAHPGGYEQHVLSQLQRRFVDLQLVECSGLTLFSPSQLPFSLDELPDTFSAFRRQVEALEIDGPMASPDWLPPAPASLDQVLRDAGFTAAADLSSVTPSVIPSVKGGEAAAVAHLQQYFSGAAASVYKDTRNALEGWDNSTKFSYWLAQGSISPRQILQRLKAYERQHGANDSTYWIYFELLWREYFHWYAHLHGPKLFYREGVQKDVQASRAPQGSFYAERFQKWCAGTTPYPIVNACMKQLATTGYLSNRGRQLAASCLIYELGIDWRFGAAYFESQLLDYDVAANWGNWQYIAGVGADPRGGRHFNLDKQAQQYDPEGKFIAKWQGAASSSLASMPLDSVDAADWPVS